MTSTELSGRDTGERGTVKRHWSTLRAVVGFVLAMFVELLVASVLGLAIGSVELALLVVIAALVSFVAGQPRLGRSLRRV